MSSRVFKFILKEELKNDLKRRMSSVIPLMQLQIKKPKIITRSAKALLDTIRLQRWWRNVQRKRRSTNPGRVLASRCRIISNDVLGETEVLPSGYLLRNEKGKVIICPITLEPIPFNFGFLIAFEDLENTNNAVFVSTNEFTHCCVMTASFKCPISNRELTPQQVMTLQRRYRLIEAAITRAAKGIITNSLARFVYDEVYLHKELRKMEINLNTSLITGLERQCDNAFAKLLESLLVDSEKYLLPVIGYPVPLEEDDADSDVEDEETQLNVSDFELIRRLTDFQVGLQEYVAAVEQLAFIDPTGARQIIRGNLRVFSSNETTTRLLDNSPRSAYSEARRQLLYLSARLLF